MELALPIASTMLAPPVGTATQDETEEANAVVNKSAIAGSAKVNIANPPPLAQEVCHHPFQIVS